MGYSYNFNSNNIITWYMLSSYYALYVLNTLCILSNLIVLTTWCYMCDHILFYLIDRETDTYQKCYLKFPRSHSGIVGILTEQGPTGPRFLVKIVILYHSISIKFKFSKISIILKICTLPFKNISKVICGMLHIGELWGRTLGFKVRQLHK